MAYLSSTAFIQRSALRLHARYCSLAIGLLLVFSCAVRASSGPCIGCAITGNTPVNQLDVDTYTMNAGCATGATSWTVSCGTIQSFNSNSVTILFNRSDCFSCVITAFNGTTALVSKTITINTPPPLNGGSISNPTQATVNYGYTPVLLSAIGESGGRCPDGFTYQWWFSLDNSTWNVVSNSDVNNYQPGPLTQTTYYKRLVVCGAQSAYTSNIATVNVYPQIIPGSISPGTQNANYNWTPAGLSISAGSGGNGVYDYQWQSSPDNSFSNPTNVGADATSYQPPPLQSSTYYRVIVTSNGAPVGSAPAFINVYPVVSAGSVSPAPQNINYNTAPVALTANGISGGNGSYTYQWQSSADIGFSNPANVGTGTTSFQPSALTASQYYRIVVTSNGSIALGNPVLINVYAPLQAGNITPASASIAYGASPGTLTVNNVSGGNGSYTYLWESSTDGGASYTQIGNFGASYTPANLTANTTFRVIVSSNGISVTSNGGTITVAPQQADLNYIRIRDITKPGVTDVATTVLMTNPQDIRQTTQYFDGLGRPVQLVAKQTSPTQHDMIAMQVYDPLDRESLHYLPYTSPSTDGNFKVNALAEQNAFNTAQFPGEQYYYGQTSFEPSPLNRSVLNAPAGINWVGSNRGVSSQYQLNTDADSVQEWISSPAAGTVPISSGAYAAGLLFKTISADEQGHQQVEFTDIDGHVLLKKVQLSPTPGPAHVGWLCTYYVYDDMNNQRFVVSPHAIELLQVNGNWNITQSIADELCFRYEYDARHQMVIKKAPGAGETWMIYDQWDKLILTQDANMRPQNKWVFTKYDGLDRPIVTGFYTNTIYTTQSTMQNYVLSLNMGRYEQLTGPIAYSLTQTFPPVAQADVLTFKFYDDYKWAFGDHVVKDNSYDSHFATPDNSTYPYPQALTAYNFCHGSMTGSWDATMPGPLTGYYYDDRGRLVQMKYFNQTSGLDITTTQYSFSGKVLGTYLKQQMGTGISQTHYVQTKMEYDPAGRIQRIWKNIDNAPSDQLIATLYYNELGQLRAKYLGNALDSLIYDYNIRGWLYGINRQYVGGHAGNYFGLEVGYDKAASLNGTTYSIPAFNGNIAGLTWKSAGDDVNRKYDFTYDNANRLMSALFLQNNGSGNWERGTMDYSVSNLGYDANGNILSMTQNGFKIGTPTSPIDQLIYSYQPGSNKLSQVTDGADDKESKLGDFHYDPATKGAVDYTYDNNGNLITDNNKSITGITYNYLNLPTEVDLTGYRYVYYYYDNSGNKLKKISSDHSVNPEYRIDTKYMSGIVYQNDTVQYIGHEEGRARWAFHRYANGDTAHAWEYDFYEKDHLGNTRVLLSQQKDTALYIATMEAAYRANEMALFYNIDSTSYPRSSVSGYPADNTTVPNDSVARVNGSGHKIGPALLLKVMRGDNLLLGTRYFYHSGGTATTANNSFQDVLNSLAGGLVAIAGGTHGAMPALNNPGSPVYAAVNSFLPTNEPPTTNTPKAYLNWMLLDNQFNYVGGNQSGALPVSAPDILNTLGTSVNINHSGYLYIWVSNETPNWDVFFDNLSVRTISGPLLEETHYYPFGLTMAGISDKTLKTQYPSNKHKFNNGTELQNQEFADGSGLEIYMTANRILDPQLGRFWQIDPMASLSFSFSTYEFANNNPILLNDPLGLTGDTPRFKILQPVVVTPANNRYQTQEWFNGTRLINLNFKGELEKYTQRRRAGLNPIQPGDHSWYKNDIKEFDLEGWYQREKSAKEAEEQFYMIYFGAAALPFLAPEYVAYAPEMIGTKALVSTVAQGVINGRNNIDVIAVGADAFLPFGSNVVVNGAISWKPGADKDKFKLIGYNKSFSDAVMDAGSAFIFGGIGNAAKAGLPPLKGHLEKNLFEVGLGFPASASQQGVNHVLTEKTETHK